MNKGTSVGADGSYEITRVGDGTYTVRATMVGFEPIEAVVTVSGSDQVVNFEMKMANAALEALEVFASRAIERETPVAFSDLDEQQIQQQLTDNILLSTVAYYSGIKYSHKNHFTQDSNGDVLTLNSDFISGYQVKGGLLYRLGESIDGFGNIGFVLKPSIIRV